MSYPPSADHGHRSRRRRQLLLDNLLLALTLISVFMGIAIGFALRFLEPSQRYLLIKLFKSELIDTIGIITQHDDQPNQTGD